MKSRATTRNEPLSSQAPTRFLTALVVAGVLGGRIAGRFGAWRSGRRRPTAATTATKDKPRQGQGRGAEGQGRRSKGGATEVDRHGRASQGRRLRRSPSPPTSSPPSVELAAVKDAIAAARKGKTSQADDLQKTISDPVARKLVEWAILRSDETEQRRVQPLHGLRRRKSELAGHRHAAPPRRGDAVVGSPRSRASCARFSPRTGRSPRRASSRSPARSCCKATAPARRAWCARPGATTTFPASSRARSLDVFRDLITTADHKARMDMRLYAEDVDGGHALGQPRRRQRARHRQGPHRRDQEGGQRQGAARRRAGADAQPRHRPHLQPRPVAAPRRQDGRGGRADPVGPARPGAGASTATSGGSSGG